MSTPLASHSWPHSMDSVYFSLKAFEVGGIRTHIVFSLFQTLPYGADKLRGAWLTAGASPREGNSPKTEVIHDLLWAWSSYTGSMSGIFLEVYEAPIITGDFVILYVQLMDKHLWLSAGSLECH